MTDANQQRDLQLIARVRAGDHPAKEELVKKYVPMVKHIVRNHYASFLEFDDLMQEGLIGLLNAIEEYRPDRFDVKFSSFAYICIIRKIYNIIKQTNGNKHRLLNDAVSLHGFINSEETRTVLDLCQDQAQPDPVEIVEQKLVNRDIARILRNHLSFLEYTVITLLLQGYSCTEIERAIGVTTKVVDNARTRVKLKLKRLLAQYGSLLSPKVPLKVRRRKDLYLKVKLSGC